MRSNQEFRAMFPTRQLPTDMHDCKLLGLGKQIDGERWFQRVKIPAGHLTGEQWRTLAQLAIEHTSGVPLHLTTRQDIEFHHLTDEAIVPLQAALADAGLTTLGGSGDSVRNVVVCSCSSALHGALDLEPVAIQIDKALRNVEGLYALPRKFKVSLSCTGTCGKPFVHGVGLVATRRGEEWGFRAIVAGSLGANPGLGIELTPWIPASHAAPLVVSMVKLFAAHGDRTNRRKARLRHIRERMGNEAFAALAGEMFADTLAAGAWPKVQLIPNAGPFTQIVRLRFHRGDIDTDAANALARLADNDRLAIRIGTDHDVFVCGKTPDIINDALDTEPALADARRPGPHIVCCPGRETCSHGLADSRAFTQLLATHLAGRELSDVTIAVSGCPNGCTHPRVAAIGLTGGVSKDEEGNARNVFNLYTGGGIGQTDTLAQLVESKLPTEAALAAVDRLLADT